MTKKRANFSINVISVLIVLISLFIGIVGYTNAWFTSEHNNGVQIVVDVGNLKLTLYQGSREVYSNAQNANETTKSYIQIEDDKRIIPNEKFNLNLTLKNEDQGSTSMYVRFKFELYVRGVADDTLIPTTIEGFVQPTQNSNGFVYNNDGYYYYKTAGGALAYFAQGTNNATLMNGFTVDYSSFINSNYERINTAGSVYIKLIVQGSVTSW